MRARGVTILERAIAKQTSRPGAAGAVRSLTASPPQACGDACTGLNIDDHNGTVTSNREPDSRLPLAPERAWGRFARVIGGLSLSRAQALIGTVAGIASIIGAAFSLFEFARPANRGELVAIVQEAGSHRGVADATIEILTPQNALVATLTPDSSGRATQDLKEGAYTVRVSHPRYAAEARRIQVMPRQTTEVRANMRTGSSSPIERVVNNGVNALRKALRF